MSLARTKLVLYSEQKINSAGRTCRQVFPCREGGTKGYHLGFFHGSRKSKRGLLVEGKCVDTKECAVTLLIGLRINYRQNSVNQLLEKIVFDFAC